MKGCWIMQRRWDVFFVSLLMWMGIYGLSIAISFTAIEYFVLQNKALDTLILALIFGLPLGIIQMLVLRQRTLFYIVLKVGVLFLTFFIMRMTGTDFPRMIGDSGVGAAIGIALAIEGSFYLFRGTIPSLSADFFWIFTSALGWSIGFDIINKIWRTMIEITVKTAPNYDSAAYIVVCFASLIGGSVIGLISGLVFAWKWKSKTEFNLYYK